MATMDDARAELRRVFGYDNFRKGQVDVVASVIAGNDTLGVLPTGGGKSLCYQVPALVAAGLTVVISPLISLMKDQVDRLQRLGVSATFLNSTLATDEARDRMGRIRDGAVKLLYVAPERFEGQDLGQVLAHTQIAMLAVDEAHCISEWGHEFRPSFRRIAAIAERLGVPQTMALTATATPRVRRDIAEQLRLRMPTIVVAGFDRANLAYAVEQCADDDAKDRALVRILETHDKPAIVYAPTRAAVQRVARTICRSGLAALPYHGGLDDDHRQEVQDAFMSGQVDWMVATNAFGMGIDKPNVRLVAHYAMPATLEAYYQEAGRAGRDGQPGRCVLLHAPNDRATHEYFLSGIFPTRAAVEQTYAQWRGCGAGALLPEPRSREAQASLRVLIDCGAVERRRPERGTLHVRLLATPTRVVRELTDAAHHDELKVLRALWRLGPEQLQRGCTVSLDALPGASASRRAVLERLRAKQFLDVNDVGGGLFLARPSEGLEAFDVDWSRIARRAASERAKLDRMEAYTMTGSCRRAFVLRYFGEYGARPHCGGCDNCHNAV